MALFDRCDECQALASTQCTSDNTTKRLCFEHLGKFIHKLAPLMPKSFEARKLVSGLEPSQIAMLVDVKRQIDAFMMSFLSKFKSTLSSDKAPARYVLRQVIRQAQTMKQELAELIGKESIPLTAATAFSGELAALHQAGTFNQDTVAQLTKEFLEERKELEYDEASPEGEAVVEFARNYGFLTDSPKLALEFICQNHLLVENLCLEGLDLAGVDLTGGVFLRSSFAGSSLQGARLDAAVFADVSLDYCDLSQVSTTETCVNTQYLICTVAYASSGHFAVHAGYCNAEGKLYTQAAARL